MISFIRNFTHKNLQKFQTFRPTLNHAHSHTPSRKLQIFDDIYLPEKYFCGRPHEIYFRHPGRRKQSFILFWLRIHKLIEKYRVGQNKTRKFLDATICSIFFCQTFQIPIIPKYLPKGRHFWPLRVSFLTPIHPELWYENTLFRANRKI